MTTLTDQGAGMATPWQFGLQLWADAYQFLMQPWRAVWEFGTATVLRWADTATDWLTHYFPAGEGLAAEGRALLDEMLAAATAVTESGVSLPVSFLDGAPSPAFGAAWGLMQALGRAVRLWWAWLSRIAGGGWFQAAGFASQP